MGISLDCWRRMKIHFFSLHFKVHIFFSFSPTQTKRKCRWSHCIHYKHTESPFYCLTKKGKGVNKLLFYACRNLGEKGDSNRRNEISRLKNVSSLSPSSCMLVTGLKFTVAMIPFSCHI